MNIEKFTAEEVKGQKWRTRTPKLLSANLLGTILSPVLMVGLAGYFANIWVENIKTEFLNMNTSIKEMVEDNKSDKTALWSAISTLKHDQVCTRIGLANCCGHRADAAC